MTEVPFPAAKKPSSMKTSGKRKNHGSPWGKNKNYYGSNGGMEIRVKNCVWNWGWGGPPAKNSNKDPNQDTLPRRMEGPAAGGGGGRERAQPTTRRQWGDGRINERAKKSETFVISRGEKTLCRKNAMSGAHVSGPQKTIRRKSLKKSEGGTYERGNPLRGVM